MRDENGRWRGNAFFDIVLGPGFPFLMLAVILICTIIAFAVGDIRIGKP